MASGFDIITIFPAIINAYLNEGIIKRALQKGLIDVQIYNLRDFTPDKHRTVDDYPYGGGPGMVMKVEPIYNAIETIKSDGVKRKVILLSPQGKTYNQKIAERFSNETKRLLFICGRYEGVDERVREFLVDEEISVGDYVLSGGELAALSIIDSVSRLIPDVVGDSSSLQEESFSWGLLDYPYYTRPALFKDMKVPEELLLGNHKSIKKWRKKHALKKTLLERPDLLKNIKLDKEDEQILEEICSENE